jgi:hypothetical protein
MYDRMQITLKLAIKRRVAEKNIAICFPPNPKVTKWGPLSCHAVEQTQPYLLNGTNQWLYMEVS